MIAPGTRIARFVRAARTLLLLQLVAAVIAVALGVWAVVAVRDLATERDRLRSQLTAAEARPSEAAPSAAAPAPASSDMDIRPPALMPIFVPIEAAPAPVEPTQPVTDAVEPSTPETPPSTTPPTETECTGDNANDPRCRPGRWNRRDPVLRRPIERVRPEPQPGRTPDSTRPN